MPAASRDPHQIHAELEAAEEYQAPPREHEQVVASGHTASGAGDSIDVPLLEARRVAREVFAGRDWARRAVSGAAARPCPPGVPRSRDCLARSWIFPGIRLHSEHDAENCGGRGAVVGGVLGSLIGCPRGFEPDARASVRAVRRMYEGAQAVGSDLGDPIDRVEERVRLLPRPASQAPSRRSSRPPSPPLRAADSSPDCSIQDLYGGERVLAWHAWLQPAPRLP